MFPGPFFVLSLKVGSLPIDSWRLGFSWQLQFQFSFFFAAARQLSMVAV